MYAAWLRKLAAILHQLLAGGASMEALDDRGDTALLHACLVGHTAGAHALVEAGADYNRTHTCAQNFSAGLGNLELCLGNDTALEMLEYLDFASMDMQRMGWAPQDDEARIQQLKLWFRGSFSEDDGTHRPGQPDLNDFVQLDLAFGKKLSNRYIRAALRELGIDAAYIVSDRRTDDATKWPQHSRTNYITADDTEPRPLPAMPDITWRDWRRWLDQIQEGAGTLAGSASKASPGAARAFVKTMGATQASM